MNVSPSYRNSLPSFAALSSRKSVGVDFGAVMRAKQDTRDALTSQTAPAKNGFQLHSKVILNYGLDGGGNGIGYSYIAKYAETSTEENPIVTVDWIDPDGNKHKEDIVLNDIDPRNATFVEMAALEAHLRTDTYLGPVVDDNANIPYDRKMNQIAGFEKTINTLQRCGYTSYAQDYIKHMNAYLDFFEKAKAAKTDAV